jgi:glutathione synthase
MTLKIAIQMDDICKINFKSDSTFIMALEAQERNYELYYYQPSQLCMFNKDVYAYVSKAKFFNDPKCYYEFEDPEIINLKSMDIILMRQDPPFDMNYITACHMLENISDSTLIINNPKEVRNCPEKLFVCNFPNLMPPTLITQNINAIKNFREQYQDIVIKPLYAHGGKDVFRVKYDDENFLSIISSLQTTYNHPFVIQKFLPEIVNGDKRIILVDGVPAGAISRVPEIGQIKSNLIAGGTAKKCQLNDRDYEICNIIGPELSKRGLLLAGIDIIGEYVTEINVTSPTGLASINNLYQINITSIIWDKIIQKLS